MHVIAGRRFVRPQAVLRRRAGGRRDLPEDGQAGQADVAPHRRLPARPRPPDVPLAGPRDVRARQRGHLRAAPHERRHRLHPRARRDAHRDGREAARSAASASPRRSSSSPRRSRTTSASRRSCSTRCRLKFHTGSMRDIYSPNVVCARELIVDRLAAAMGKDPVAFRRAFLKHDRARAVLDKVAEVGQWGRAMPEGTAQGIAVHTEFKALHGGARRDRLPPGDGRAGRSRDGVHRAARHQGRDGGRRRPADQPARPGGPDDRLHQRRHRAGAHREPAHPGRAAPGGQLGQLLLHAAVEHPDRRARSS